MGRSKRTPLFIIFVTTFFTGYCGNVTSNSSLQNWFNAVKICNEQGKMLSDIYNASFPEKYHWTGYHIRLSGWIKIIGCFEESSVKDMAKKSHEMRFPSAGFCQEVCLQFNFTVFGLKSSTCVCLEQLPEKGSRGSNSCPYSCEMKYYNETDIKFPKDCGGLNSYSLFKAGTDVENSVPVDTECLSFQCAENSKIFLTNECNEPIARICNTTVYKSSQSSWQTSSSSCKSNNHSYLYGDVNLTDVISTCQHIQGKVTGPTWLGIAKEKYISFHREQDKIFGIQRPPFMTKPMKCLKCNSFNCVFDSCYASHNVECMEWPRSTTQFSKGTTHTTLTTKHQKLSSVHHSSTGTSAFFDTTRNAPGVMKNESDSAHITMIVVPVTAILTIGSVLLLLVIFWRRRQAKMISKAKSDSPKNSIKYPVDQSSKNNYFTLEKTKSNNMIDSSSLSKPEYSESPDKESGSGLYDHLGEKVRKKDEEDTYHHAFFSSNDDESDYGIRNINDDSRTENPYDHTNTGAFQVSLPDIEYSTILFNT